jgi:hypothetical protein
MLSGKFVVKTCITTLKFRGLSTDIKFSLNRLFINSLLLTVCTSIVRVLIHGYFSKFMSVKSLFLHTLHRTNNYNNNLIKYIAINNGGWL